MFKYGSIGPGAKDIYKRYPKGKERKENKLNIQTQGFTWLRPRTTRRQSIGSSVRAEVLEKLSALTRHPKYNACTFNFNLKLFLKKERKKEEHVDLAEHSNFFKSL